MTELPKPPALDLDEAVDLKPVSGEIAMPEKAPPAPVEDELLSLEPLEVLDSGPTDPVPLPRAPAVQSAPKKRATLTPPTKPVTIPENPDAPRDVPPPEIQGGESKIDFGFTKPARVEATQISTGIVRNEGEHTMETFTRGSTQVGPRPSDAERTLPDLTDMLTTDPDLGGVTDEMTPLNATTKTVTDSPTPVIDPAEQAERLSDVSEVLDELGESISQLRSQMYDSLGEIKNNVDSVRQERQGEADLDLLQRRFDQLEEDTASQLRSQRAWSRMQTVLILGLLAVVVVLLAGGGAPLSSAVRGWFETQAPSPPEPAVTPAAPEPVEPVAPEPPPPAEAVEEAPPEEPPKPGKRRRKRRRRAL